MTTSINPNTTIVWTAKDEVIQRAAEKLGMPIEELLRLNSGRGSRRTIYTNGTRHVCDGSYMGSQFGDLLPPQLGDTVTSGRSETSWRTEIPPQPGVVFYSQGELPVSAAYEALTGQRTLGRAEELGVWFSVRRIIYVTRSDQFQKGLRDAGESPLRYNAEPSWSLQQAAEYRRGWLLKQSDYIPSWLDDPCWVAARLVLLLSFKAIERMAASAAAFGFDGTDVERFDKELEAHRPLDFRPLVVE